MKKLTEKETEKEKLEKRIENAPDVMNAKRERETARLWRKIKEEPKTKAEKAALKQTRKEAEEEKKRAFFPNYE